MSKDDILGSDPYRDRVADSEDEAELTEYGSTPSLYRYHDSVSNQKPYTVLMCVVAADRHLQVIVLIPKDKLHKLLDTDADRLHILRMVLRDLDQNRNYAGGRKHVLEIMHKTLNTHRPPTSFYGQVLTVLPHWHETSMIILENSWEHRGRALGDELYRDPTLLEGPPGSGVPGAVGTKREADDELPRPPARRRGFAG